jgi:hypothetical protein
MSFTGAWESTTNSDVVLGWTWQKAKRDGETRESEAERQKDTRKMQRERGPTEDKRRRRGSGGARELARDERRDKKIKERGRSGRGIESEEAEVYVAAMKPRNRKSYGQMRGI